MVLFSVIIPHYNSTIFLKRLLRSIPMDESIQVIVADDKSTEDIMEVKDLVIARGGLFLHNTTDGKNAGVCRNLGLAHAVGKWLVFADADDYFLDEAFNIMEQYADSAADIIYFSPISRYENTETPAKRHISYQKIVKRYVEAPSNNTEMLLRYRFVSPWSKMIRNQLVQENQIRFDEVPAANDVMFSMRTAYSANKISASMEEIYCISSAKSTLTTKRCKQNYWARVEVFVDRYHFVQENLNPDKYALILPTGLSIIRQAIRQKYDFIFICQIYVFLMKNHVKIFSLKKNWALWKCTSYKELFRFNIGDKGSQDMLKIYRTLLRKINRKLNCILKKYVSTVPLRFGLNETAYREKKIIISLASYQERYSTICLTLKSLLLQTVRPDRIIVWLDENNAKNTLTSEMQQFEKYGIEYRFTDLTLKSHKKYFYAMQEFPEDIIITVDDDCIYSPLLIKTLLRTHRKFPDSICARRVHLITFNENHSLNLYDDWIREVCYIRTPSFFLCAIGNGGILYPPALLPRQTFDVSCIQEHFISTDDLWLKTMELLNKVKVVWAPCYIVRPPNVPNSQTTTLFSVNLGAFGNNNKSLEMLQKKYPHAFEILKQSLSERPYVYKNATKKHILKASSRLHQTVTKNSKH